MSSFSALSFLYGGQFLFVDRDWHTAEQMESHHFWSWRRVPPSRVMGGRCLVNFESCVKKILWLEKCQFSNMTWMLVGRKITVVQIWSRECCIDVARCHSFDIINLFVKKCVQYLLMFFHFCIKCLDVGNTQFVKAGFIRWDFGRNLFDSFFIHFCLGTCIYKICGLEGQGLDMCVFVSNNFEVVIIVCDYGWCICEIFLILVYLGTCIFDLEV